MSFHLKNGGLSRYVKFRYFFEKIRLQEITDEEVLNWDNKFSEIMLQLLTDKDLIINEVLNYIKNNQNDKVMHIISASDQKELRIICNKLEINNFFKSIYGSPTSKILNIKNLLKKYSYNKNDVVLIGDTINDKEAAIVNKINFRGYNNSNLIEFGNYIQNFN